MPNITDISKRKKNFAKKSYRAWSFSSNDNASFDQTEKKIKAKNTATNSKDESTLNSSKKTKINSTNQELNNPTVSKNKNNLSSQLPIKNKQPLKKISYNDTTIEEQSVSNQLAEREQIVSSPLAVREQIVSEKLAEREQIVSSPLAVREHTVSISVSKDILYWVNTLSGKEKALVDIIYSLCKARCNLETHIIPTNYLLTELKVRSEHLRNLFKRISQKNILKIISYKGGWGAGRVVALAEEVYIYYQGKENKHIPLAPPLAGMNVVSSSNINTTTNSIPQEWRVLDLEPLQEHGLTESHIIQIYREYEKKPGVALSLEIIQASINHLSFDLRHNDAKKKIKSEPVPFLVQLLKQGRPYSSITPEKVTTLQEEAIQKYKAVKDAERKRIEALLEEVKAMERKEWFDKLSEEDVKSIGTKTNSRLKKDSIDADKFEIKIYFAKEVWPAIEARLRKEKVIID